MTKCLFSVSEVLPLKITQLTTTHVKSRHDPTPGLHVPNAPTPMSFISFALPILQRNLVPLKSDMTKKEQIKKQWGPPKNQSIITKLTLQHGTERMPHSRRGATEEKKKKTKKKH